MISPPHQSQNLSEEERKTILAELETILESTQFRSSQQCRRFLSYVVTHTLNGDEGSLRERVVGNVVFGRPPDYDTSDDPVVRLRASEVRKRLAQYYQSLEQPPDIRLLIPSGSYKAAFLSTKGGPPEHSDDSLIAAESHGELLRSEDAPLITASGQEPPVPLHGEIYAKLATRRPWLLPLLSLLALVAITSLWLLHVAAGQPETLVKHFWQPLLSSPKPVLISVGSNAVYRVSDDVADQYGKQHHLESSGMEFFPDLSPDITIQASGIHPAPDSFVALGDVASVSQIVAQLTRMQKPFQERFSNDISFAEVRSSPTILVGGFNNAMTRELTKNFRFVFVSRNRIEDRQKPGQVWVLQASEDSHDTEDYGIISRILPQDGTSALISVAGLGQYGTLAATEFVSDPARIEDLNRIAPKGWQNRNLQILLHIKVRDFKPDPAQIVAVHTW
jgi:hypothetical protein